MNILELLGPELIFELFIYTDCYLNPYYARNIYLALLQPYELTSELERKLMAAGVSLLRIRKQKEEPTCWGCNLVHAASWACPLIRHECTMCTVKRPFFLFHRLHEEILCKCGKPAENDDWACYVCKYCKPCFKCNACRWKNRTIRIYDEVTEEARVITLEEAIAQVQIFKE